MLKEGGAKTFKQTGGWLGFTDKYWAAALVPDQTVPYEARFSGAKGPKDTFQADFSTGPDIDRARCEAELHYPACLPAPRSFTLIEAYGEQLEGRAVRPAGRLGLVPFHHQAPVQAAALAGPVLRQLRPRYPRHDGAREAGVLPAGQQELRVDGQDEDAAAGDGEAARALQGRSRQAAAGTDGHLQGQEDQPDGGLPADPAANPGVLCAVQGAVHHHRYAARTLLRLDQGSFGARSDVAVQPVRPAALRGA